MKKFALISVGLTAIIGALTWGALHSTDWFVETEWLWLSLGFFFLLTNLVFFMVSNAMNRRNQTFMYAMGGSMGLRFIMSILFIVSYLNFCKERELSIIVYFMLMYLLYTMFEIYFLLIKLRAAKKEETGDTTN